MRANNTEAVFNEIDNLLEQHKLPFCFDITSDDRLCCLILSPEGDESAARAIDDLVNSAPAICDWKIFGRRQKKCLDDVRAIIKNLYLIDPSYVRFRIYDGNEDQCVEAFVPESADITPEEGQGLINTFLWHSIGEDVVMKRGIKASVRFGEPVDITDTLSVSELVERFEAN